MHMRRFQCSERGIKIEVAGGVSGLGGAAVSGLHRTFGKGVFAGPSTARRSRGATRAPLQATLIKDL